MDIQTGARDGALHRIPQIGLTGRPLRQAYDEMAIEIQIATGFPVGAIVLLDEVRDRLVFSAPDDARGADRAAVVPLTQ
jgi:hypothetical protein